ncbi:MAG: hypothetical protein Q8N05_19780 [Bacteroidota bacterium]|nr:hypothetical protein [Bacteroidota bacterium]
MHEAKGEIIEEELEEELVEIEERRLANFRALGKSDDYLELYGMR